MVNRAFPFETFSLLKKICQKYFNSYNCKGSDDEWNYICVLMDCDMKQYSFYGINKLRLTYVWIVHRSQDFLFAKIPIFCSQPLAVSAYEKLENKIGNIDKQKYLFIVEIESVWCG